MAEVAEHSLDDRLSLEALIERVGDPERFRALVDDAILVIDAGHVDGVGAPFLCPLLKLTAVPVVLGDVRRNPLSADGSLEVLAVVHVVALDQGQDGAEHGLVEQSIVLHLLQFFIRLDDAIVAVVSQRHQPPPSLRPEVVEPPLHVAQVFAVPQRISPEVIFVGLESQATLVERGRLLSRLGNLGGVVRGLHHSRDVLLDFRDGQLPFANLLPFFFRLLLVFVQRFALALVIVL